MSEMTLPQAAPVQPALEAAPVQPQAAPREEPASGEEQAEYERAMEELSNVLYKNENASNALLKMVQPEDKIATTTKAIIMLITEMDKKANIDESVFYNLTLEAADRLIDMAEAKGVKFSEREMQQIAMASWEGIMGAMGGEEPMDEAYGYLSQGVSDAELEEGKAVYEDLKRG